MSPLEEELHVDVTKLAGEIGERNTRRFARLEAAAAYLEDSFAAAGYRPRSQPVQADGKPCRNVEGELRGQARPDEIVVIGAHYDSVVGCPGANDNASGVAALLALARRFARRPAPARTLRFVAFVNEEPPFFKTAAMGSLVYARAAHARQEAVAGMLSLETLGCYCDAPGSQRYPLGFLSRLYPDRGDFLGFVANLPSRRLLRQALGAFRGATALPAEGAVLPGAVAGVSWSDHWSFWQQGYPAVMVTDTAPYRYAQYHTADDTPDRLDYRRLGQAIVGLEAVATALTT